MSATWQEVERPVGPQPLPAWLKGVHVDWMDRYGNPPSVSLKVHGDVREWDRMIWTREGDHYRCRHEDGRMRQLTHAGTICMTTMRLFRTPDGEFHQYGFVNGGVGEWVEVSIRTTDQQQGFDGSYYFITMDDGEPLVLRGPWNTVSPAGYVEVAYVDTMNGNRAWMWRKKPWYCTGGIGGLRITEDLLLRAMARFAPEIRMAEVINGGWRRIEPMKPHWRAPKGFLPIGERCAS